MSEADSYPPYEPEPQLPAARPPRSVAAGHRLGRAEVTAIGNSNTAGAKAFTIIFLIVFVAILIAFAVVVLSGFLGSTGF